MKIEAYIFSWKHVTKNACEIYKNLRNICKTTIINCDEKIILPSEYNFIQLDDSYYYGGQFEEALKDISPDIYLWCIVGDVTPTANWNDIYNKAITSFNTYPIGIYAPNVDYTSHKSRLKKLSNTLWHVSNTDCTCWIIHPIILSKIRNISFKKLSNFGWGIDCICIEESLRNSLFVIRDYSEIVYQPKNTNYSIQYAKSQMKNLIAHYRSFNK